MIGRLAWFAAGAGIGVLAVGKARSATRPVTGEELRDRLHAASMGLKQARQAAAQARVDREFELRLKYGDFDDASVEPDHTTDIAAEPPTATPTPRTLEGRS